MCLCVCLGQCFHTVRIGQEDLRIASAQQSVDLKRVFFVKQPLRKATEFALAHKRVFIGVVASFAIVFACHYILAYLTGC